MKKIRIVFLIILLGLGMLLIFFIAKAKIKTQYEATLSPLFQMLGLTTKSLNRMLTRVMPVDALDEKEFGEAIKLKYEANIDKENKDYIYLNKLIKVLDVYKKKPFDYKVYTVNYDEPNAFALPGGVILVTKGLLCIVESESELISILAHEMGHIELSHCFDHVRFELLTRKIESDTLGSLADLAIDILIGYSFSKTMENEADEYSYFTILKTSYDPFSVSKAFRSLEKYEKQMGYSQDSKELDILRDYFSSHPPLALRIEKFEEEAQVFWNRHKDLSRYIGKKNLLERTSFIDKDYGYEEWARTSM